MKLAFSTIGCPDWSFRDIVASARDFGYDGIELRGIERDIYLPDVKEFSDDKIAATKEYIAGRGINICCLTSGAVLYENCKKEIEDYIDLASKLGVKYIRVLGDANPAASVYANDGKTIEVLSEVVDKACSKGVTLCLETNGIYANSARLRKILDNFGGKVGVIWDIHHPYRFYGEKPSVTYNNIKPYLKHVHIKDSVMQNGTIVYKMLGEGDVPVKEVVDILENAGFEGYISLEWVKRWNKELEEPSIVFARYIDIMRSFK